MTVSIVIENCHCQYLYQWRHYSLFPFSLPMFDPATNKLIHHFISNVTAASRCRCSFRRFYYRCNHWLLFHPPPLPSSFCCHWPTDTLVWYHWDSQVAFLEVTPSCALVDNLAATFTMGSIRAINFATVATLIISINQQTTHCPCHYFPFAIAPYQAFVKPKTSFFLCDLAMMSRIYNGALGNWNNMKGLIAVPFMWCFCYLHNCPLKRCPWRYYW